MFEEYELIWLTGQPGAGKTVIGDKIHRYFLQNSSKKSVIIDGDDIRALFENQDYSVSGRRKNVEFVQKMVDFLAKNEITPIVSLVSPFKDLREQVKTKYKTLELYLTCDEIRGREHFHVDYYEAPSENFMELNTTGKTEGETFEVLCEKLRVKIKYMKNYLVKADKVTSTTDKKYALFCGRWQPLHDGHKFIIQRVLDEGENVLICIRDVKPDEKNPFTPEQVLANIQEVYADLIAEERVKAMIIPDISSVNFGRGVGYDIVEHLVPENIADISATKVREQMRKEGKL